VCGSLSRGSLGDEGLPRCSPAPASPCVHGGIRETGTLWDPTDHPVASPSRCSTFSLHLLSGTGGVGSLLQETLAGGSKRLPTLSGLVAAWSWAARPRQDIFSCSVLGRGHDADGASRPQHCLGPHCPVRASLTPAEVGWDRAARSPRWCNTTVPWSSRGTETVSLLSTPPSRRVTGWEGKSGAF